MRGAAIKGFVAAGLAAGLLAAGCSGPGSTPSADTRTAGASPASNAPSPSRPVGEVQADVVATGLTTPWGLVPLPDGVAAGQRTRHRRDPARGRRRPRPRLGTVPGRRAAAARAGCSGWRCRRRRDDRVTPTSRPAEDNRIVADDLGRGPARRATSRC